MFLLGRMVIGSFGDIERVIGALSRTRGLGPHRLVLEHIFSQPGASMTMRNVSAHGNVDFIGPDREVLHEVA